MFECFTFVSSVVNLIYLKQLVLLYMLHQFLIVVIMDKYQSGQTLANKKKLGSSFQF